jgi:heptosyltransferase III
VPRAPNARNQSAGRDPELKRLLIRPGAIGDIIVSLPALETACCSSYNEVWVSGPCVPLIGFADRVRSIASTGLDLIELGVETPARTTLSDFDSVISWYGANRPEFREAVREFPFTFHPALPERSDVHAVDFFARQVGASDGGIPYIGTGAVQARGSIAVHPFSGSPKKNWPPGKFQELAGSLPLPVEFTAGPEEELAGAVRFDDLGSLAKWLAGARVYVGNDSGISHLAAAVGVPVVVIFRSTDPNLWAPRSRAPVCVLQGDPSVDEVRRAVLAILN